VTDACRSFDQQYTTKYKPFAIESCTRYVPSRSVATFRKVGPPLPYLIPFSFSPLSLSLSHPIFSPVPFLLYCYPGAPPARASGSACFQGEVSANLVGKWNKKKTKEHRRQNRASSITTESLRL